MKIKELFVEKLYGKYVEDASEERINDIIDNINNLLFEHQYSENWTFTTDNTFRMDLSSFSGIKQHILWVKLEKKDGFVNGLLIVLAYERMIPVLIPVVIITRDIIPFYFFEFTAILTSPKTNSGITVVI